MDELPPLVQAILREHDTRKSGERGTRDATVALLQRHGYRAQDELLAFEERYGGLEFYENDPAPSLVMGPYACLRSGAHPGPHAMVPVIFAHDDVVYFLSADGRGWAQWMGGDEAARATAEDARQLVTQAVLWRQLAILGTLTEEGEHGESWAAERALSPIEDAGDGGERWWGHKHELVVQIARGNGYPGPVTYRSRLVV